MQKYPWYRSYSADLENDKKLRRAAANTGINLFTVLGIWIHLLNLANESPERGRLLISVGMPMKMDEICEESWKLPLEDFTRVLEEFRIWEMVAWDDNTLVLTNFTKRNPESDLSTDRVRKFREKQKGVSETEMKRFRNVIEREKEEDKEKDKEGEKEIENRSAALLFSTAIEPSGMNSLEDPFERMIATIEKAIGLPVGPGPAENQAITELITLNATDEDIKSAIKWLSDNGKTVRRANEIIGSVRTAIAKRTQASLPAISPGGSGKTTAVKSAVKQMENQYAS